jgi:hypothetical protein
MNKAKYILINEDVVIAIVYENEKYGRTMVIQGKVNPNYHIKVYSIENGETICDTDFIDYLHDLLPV